MRRFAHFGIQKTTMNEIADDIKVTQPSLYYYFPDKTRLIVAVIEKILDEYFNAAKRQLEDVSSLKDGFSKIITFRKLFTQRYFMLQLDHIQNDSLLDEACGEIMQAARKTEIEVVAGLIKDAIGRGELEHSDPERISSLYLDTITGLSMSIISREHKKILLERELLDTVADRQTELTEVFLKGLKYRESKACKV